LVKRGFDFGNGNIIVKYSGFPALVDVIRVSKFKNLIEFFVGNHEDILISEKKFERINS
jgi:hypothetical protein